MKFGDLLAKLAHKEEEQQTPNAEIEQLRRIGNEVQQLISLAKKITAAGHINELWAGEARLSNEGITLPIQANNFSGHITWGTYSGDRVNWDWDAAIRAYYSSDSISLESYAGKKTDGETVEVAYVDFYAYARPDSGSDAYYVLQSHEAKDAAAQVVWYLCDGFASMDNCFMAVEKVAAGSGGGFTLGIGTYSPDTDALVDMEGDKPILLPRITTTERDAVTPANGMICYNTTTNVVEAYENGSWVNL